MRIHIIKIEILILKGNLFFYNSESTEARKFLQHLQNSDIFLPRCFLASDRFLENISHFPVVFVTAFFNTTVIWIRSNFVQFSVHEMGLRLTTSHYFYNSLWIHLITVCTYHLHVCTRHSSKHHENSATHFQQVYAGFQRVHGTEFSPIDASLESKTFFFSENILSTQKLNSIFLAFYVKLSYQPFVFKILPRSHPYPFVQFADKFICPFECYRTDYNCCKCHRP